LLALTILHACYSPEIEHGLPCAATDDCGSSSDAATTAVPASADGSSSGNVDPATTASSHGEGHSQGGSEAEAESSSGLGSEDASSSSSSSGEPFDNDYAPCGSDDECTSGYCAAGFCTTVCWSQAEGETPCPPVPDDAIGITVICGRIDSPPRGGGLCEGCFDCGQYCVAVCDGGSTCPNGSSCIADACGGPDAHCE
jgi:hypothetical protein